MKKLLNKINLFVKLAEMSYDTAKALLQIHDDYFDRSVVNNAYRALAKANHPDLLNPQIGGPKADKDPNQLIVINFREGEVKDYITMAIEESGAKYEYLRTGSRVLFTRLQFGRFLKFLQDALASDILENDEKEEINNTLAHIRKQMP